MIREQLFEVDPYAGFNALAYGRDLQGWESDHRYLPYAIDRARPSAILEVGSWKGRSAVNMARKVRELNLVCEIVCVDTWLGSPEHWLKESPDFYPSLLMKHGFPSFYNTFLTNVVAEGLQDIITPFPSTSENAAVILGRLHAKFEVAYIDAAHEYDPVLRDLKAVWPLLADRAILIGDDYYWGRVKDAAHEFAASVGAPLVEEAGKFMISKGDWSPSLE